MEQDMSGCGCLRGFRLMGRYGPSATIVNCVTFAYDGCIKGQTYINISVKDICIIRKLPVRENHYTGCPKRAALPIFKLCFLFQEFVISELAQENMSTCLCILMKGLFEILYTALTHNLSHAHTCAHAGLPGSHKRAITTQLLLC